jgi:hypothetical protein
VSVWALKWEWRATRTVRVHWALNFLVTSVFVTVETSSASELGSTSEWAEETILAIKWHCGALRAVLTEWASLARVFFNGTPLFLIGASRAWKRIDSSSWAVEAWWAISTSDVGDTSLVTVVAHIAVLAIVLVNLLGPWVVGTSFAWVQLALINLIVGFWWAVVAGWALSGISLTVLAKVTWLASNTISHLSSFSDDTLGLKWTWNGHSVTLGAVVTDSAFVTCGVRSVVELWLRAQVTSSALFGNNTGTAVATSDTLLTVLVSIVHEGTSWANRLTLLGLITNGLSNAKDWSSLILNNITIVTGWATVTLSKTLLLRDETVLAQHLVDHGVSALVLNWAWTTNNSGWIGIRSQTSCVLGVCWWLLHSVTLEAEETSCAKVLINVTHTRVWAVTAIVTVNASLTEDAWLPGTWGARFNIIWSGANKPVGSGERLPTGDHWTVVSAELVGTSLDKVKTVDQRSWGEGSNSAEIAVIIITISSLGVHAVARVRPAVLTLRARLTRVLA